MDTSSSGKVKIRSRIWCSWTRTAKLKHMEPRLSDMCERTSTPLFRRHHLHHATSKFCASVQKRECGCYFAPCVCSLLKCRGRIICFEVLISRALEIKKKLLTLTPHQVPNTRHAPHATRSKTHANCVSSTQRVHFLLPKPMEAPPVGVNGQSDRTLGHCSFS